MNALSVVILAAGQGTRMRSSLPKVLQPVAGKPLLSHVLAAVQPLQANQYIIIYGHQGDVVRAAFKDVQCDWIEQLKQQGTGHALSQALSVLPKNGQVLVVVGDSPLIKTSTLKQLLTITPENAVGLLTTKMPDPTGLGRIVRDANGVFQKIIEEKDATDVERALREINTGMYVFPAAKLNTWLTNIQPSKVTGEYYITEILSMAVAEKCQIVTLSVPDYFEVMGINDKRELALAERYYQQQRANEFMTAGVTIIDPARIDFRGNVAIGKDVVIDVNVIFEGDVTIGDRCHIGANCVLKNVTLADDVIVKPNCVLEQAQLAEHAEVGPFTRLRPGAKLAAHAHVGNFAEVKNSTVGPGSKVHHVSYVGDTTIGANVNIGAGTIVCNYDGVRKSPTVIEDGAFIGSNSALVAPVKIGAKAVIGAGSVITKNTAAGNLTIARGIQKDCGPWPRKTDDKK